MQKDTTTFYFDKLDFDVVIEPHKFYVKQANERLLSQFNDIDKEAEFVEKQRLEYLGKHFNPDWDDEGDAYEDAYQEGVSHYLAVHEMYNTVTLALTAGMFHQFDKQLREKTIRELSSWNANRDIEGMVWNLGFPSLIRLLDWVGLELKNKAFTDMIDTCRLVVNVYKHGSGDAHNELVAKHPEYYPHYMSDEYKWFDSRYDQLKVSPEQFNEFAEAISEFWSTLPAPCYYSQLQGKNDLLTEYMRSWDNTVQRRAKKK
ncbi:hypothetical protein [Pantoea sp. MBLJ3]|uniref:hypothetical protein n=1 Tax=Pantoea sp. MBLJ3 TaxID=1562889 RepID=UPI00068A7051|nr:hypothetical protein [Pantoea sp. MBLJ3]